MKKSDEIDVVGIGFIFAFVVAFIGDAAFSFSLLSFFPIIGFIFFGFIIITHYLCGLIIIGFIWSKIRGWLAKLILLLAVIIPGPLLLIGTVLAVIFSNKVLAAIAEQVIIQAAAVATAGAAEVAEVGVAAEGAATAAEGAAVAAEGVGEAAEGAAVAAEGAGGATEGAAVAAEGIEGAGGAAEEIATEEGISPEALGEEREPMEKLEKELLEEPVPEQKIAEVEETEETTEKTEYDELSEKAKKVKDSLEKAEWVKDKILGNDEEKKDEEEDEDGDESENEEGYREAA